jgi:PAT family beta-lactamase induction signal transducer AmpG
MTVSVVMYKTLGISNTDIALYTSWLYLPWVVKPLWSPLVDLLGTKRRWILAMQFAIGVALALVAFTLPTTHFFQMTLAMLWLLAFASATHDIAADGFYMLALEESAQAAFVGVRSAFYRVATITAQGGVVYAAGQIAELSGNNIYAWTVVFGAMALTFALLAAWHWRVLPVTANDRPVAHGGFLDAFGAFFRRPGIAAILAFLLLFRFAEAQALKLVAPFLLDPTSAGGLGLTTSQVGITYGTVGVVALTAGGLLGGYAIARGGLGRWIWPMAFAMHLPNALFLYLAWAQPRDVATITTALALEQFGYGFGFAAYLVFMMRVADGPWKTAHYAICTGFMALGMMIPGMASGWIQAQLGYTGFFAWVCLATIPAFLAIPFARRVVYSSA